MGGMNERDRVSLIVVTSLLIVTFLIVATILGLMETRTPDAPTYTGKSPLSTHVLDIARGLPASGIPVTVSYKASLADPEWTELAAVETNTEGRADSLVPESRFVPGLYRLKFNTATYFTNRKVIAFYPYIEVIFNVRSTLEHYHVPILLSPFGYSTYRGS